MLFLVNTVYWRRRWFNIYANNDFGPESTRVITRPLMSITTPARASLADVIELISKAEVPEKRKQDLRSAVRTIVKLLDADPASIVADPALLRRKVEEISPHAHGLSNGRWANIRSLLGKALALARPMIPSRNTVPVLAEWEALTQGLAFYRRVSVLPLLRFLSMRSVGPAQVTAADLEAYRDAIHAARLRKSPEKTWDHLTWVWNGCVRDVPSWPSIMIERKPRRRIYVLPWANFPPSLKEDVDRFLDRLSGRDLSDDGPVRPARLSTIKTREYQLRVAASALVQCGHHPQTLRSIADLLSFERYQEILRVLMGRHGGETSPQVGQIAAFLKDVARHWLKVDELELQRFKKIASRLAVGRRGLTTKNRERLRPFDEPETIAAFLGLPQRIRGVLNADKRSPRRKAILAQMAAAIALLQAAPIRLRNLTDLDVVKNLIGRGRRLYLVIPEADTKNREPIDFELPAETAEILSWYVREHRPVLLKQPTDALFPGAGTKAKSSGALATQISKTMLKFTGLKVNVHLFRHAGGKIFLDARPGQYEVMRRVLSHRSITTTSSFYAGAETRAAGQHFAAVIAERRRALERDARSNRSNKPSKGSS